MRAKFLSFFFTFFIFTFGLFAQSDQMEICAPMYVCQNSLTALECAGCDANSFFGPNVVEINGVYYFDSSSLTPGQYAVEAQCPAGTPPVSVTVMPSQLTINGQPYYNDTLQYCLPSNGYQLGINNLLPGYSISWSQVNGLNNPLGISPFVNPTVTTTYIVTVTAPDNYTICTNQITLIPVQGNNLTLGISNANICLGQSISLTPTVLPQNSNWIINSNTGQSWNSQNLPALIYPSQSSVYTLSVTNNSCTNSVQASVSVQTLPIGSVAPLQEKCVGDLFYLSAQTSSSNQVSWYNQSGQLVGVGPNTGQYAQFSQTYSCLITNSSGCSTTIPVNLSVNLNCCINDSPLPSNISYTIATNTIWNAVNYTLTNDIVVMPGISLTILNSTLKFGNLKGIILQEGADLNIVSSTLTNLTNCPHAWKGISAAHSSSYTMSSLNFSSITIKESVISHAYRGINLLSIPFTQQASTPLGSTPWVYLNCMDSSFEDNLKDCNFEGVSTQNQLSAVFTKCKFTITSNYPNYLSHDLNQISLLNNQNTFVFNACQFLNDKPNFLIGSTELCAIQSNRCGLKITSPINTVQNSANFSLFRGFTRGIVHLGGNELLIENTDFRCVRSVFQSGCLGSVTISKCRFVNLPLNFIPAYANPFIQNVGSASIEPLPGELPNNSIHYGCYLDGCIGKISFLDNYVNTNKTFSGYPATPFLTSASNITEHGVILNQCQTKYGLIARNTFTQMKRAIKFQGQNKIDLQSGVKYSCNAFFGNGKDIVELQGSSTTQLAGVPDQHINLKDPSNIFNQSGESYDDIFNSNLPHKYYKTTGSSNPNVSETTGITYMLPQSDLMVDCTTLIFSNDLISNFILSSEVNQYWQATKDGGNTEELINVIQSADFSSTLNDLYDVVQSSPMLSNESIAELLDNQNIPNYLLSQLVSYNASVMREPEFVEKLNTRAIALSEFEQQIIDQGLNLWTSKDYLMNQLAYLEEEHNYLLNEILMTNDSILSAHQKDSLMQENTFPSTFKSDYRKEILHFISEGRFDDAGELLGNFEQWFNYLPSEKDEYNELLSLLSILSSSDTVSYTEFIQSNNVQSIFSKQACFAYLGDSISTIRDVIFEELENRSSLLNNTSSLQFETRIFPNPTSGNFFNIELPYSDCLITISNNLGETIYSNKYILNFGLIRINTNDLSKGIYLITIRDLKTGKIENHKLIIQ